MLARGVAFALPIAIGALYGAKALTDSFFYALAFPTFLMVIVANAVGAVTTPVVAKLRESDPDQVGGFVGNAMLVAALLALGWTAIVLAALPIVLPITSSFDAENQMRTMWFVAGLAPLMVLNAAGTVLKATAEVYGRFAPVAVSPLLRGLTSILLVVVLAPTIGAPGLPIALGGGELVQTVWFYALVRREGVRIWPTLAIGNALRQFGRDLTPMITGELMVAANVIVDKAFAASLPEGNVALLEFADRTRFIPQTLLESTLIPVAFATWAIQLARGSQPLFAVQVEQSLRWVATWSAPPLAGLYVARHVLCSWLYVRGEFTEADASAAAEAFGWYVPGLWPMMLGALAMRAHVAGRHMTIVAVLGLVSVALNFAFNGLLVGPMGINGLALGSTLVWVIVPGAYLAMLTPTIAPVVSLRSWVVPLAITGASLAVAATFQLLGLIPLHLSDPSLWIAASLLIPLLGLGALLTRPPRATLST